MSATLQKWISSIQSIRREYALGVGHAPRLLRPKLFGEKIQWRKLFDDNPLFTILSDKYAARSFIESRGYGHLLIPLLWIGDDPADIPLETLDPPFVIKSTHGSAHVIIVDCRPYDVPAIKRQATEWLSYCYGSANLEPGYIRVPKRLIIERKLGGDLLPTEYKLFVFHGVVRVINFIVTARDRSQRSSFHLPDWERLPWIGKRPPLKEAPSKPQDLGALIKIAEALGAGLDHVRVDCYEQDGSFYVGELTLYSQSGFGMLESSDVFLGSFWKIKRPVSKALQRIFFTEWGRIRAG